MRPPPLINIRMILQLFHRPIEEYRHKQERPPGFVPTLRMLEGGELQLALNSGPEFDVAFADRGFGSGHLERREGVTRG
jgi:hypothetical protein